MKSLIKQLKSNTKALEEIETVSLNKQGGRNCGKTKAFKELTIARKLLLNTRYTILENIQLECTKEMQRTSTRLQRTLNLKLN